MKLFYTIAEVAAKFDVLPSKLRHYEKYFGLKIQQRGGERIYTEKNIQKFEEIFHLVEVEKLTLEGAKEKLKKYKKNMNEKGDLVDRLIKMKEFLEIVKDNCE